LLRIKITLTINLLIYLVALHMLNEHWFHRLESVTKNALCIGLSPS